MIDLGDHYIRQLTYVEIHFVTESLFTELLEPISRPGHTFDSAP